MKIEDFQASLNRPGPPDGLSPYLTALWHEKHGDWNAAHEVIQEINDPTAAWIHAYLHRKQGEEDNASYWYRRAGKPFPSYASDQEWDEIAEALL
jgi:hypothetical protein